MTPAVLAIDDLTIRYATTAAVERLSLTVHAGEVFGLLGPNGCGKSSTLGAVVGTVAIAAGTIRVAGHDLRRQPDAYRQAIGLVPQELALFDELTAEQNLRFFGRLYGLGGAELRRRVAEVLAFVRLLAQAGRSPRTFSGGMQRRLNLACALLHRPRLLLLDEPTVGLDIQSRDAIFATLRDLRDRGTAMVFTTHHLEEAEQLCDRIGILDAGRLAALGTLAELDARLSDMARWRLDGTPVPARRGGRLERVFLELTGRRLRE